MVQYMYMKTYTKKDKKTEQLKIMVDQELLTKLKLFAEKGKVSEFVRDSINEKLARLTNNDAG